MELIGLASLQVILLLCAVIEETARHSSALDFLDRLWMAVVGDTQHVVRIDQSPSSDW